MLQRLRSVVGDINRLRVILVVFFEEGFDVVIGRGRLSYLVPLTARMSCFFRRCRYPGKRKSQPVSAPQRLRRALERLGPTFVKFGQLLSLHSDIIPPDFVKELQKLQSNASVFPFDEVKKIIREELNCDIKDVFKEFDVKPFAAASLSQVHKARLRDNTEVAVKVQRPNLRPIIENDIHILFFLASLAEKNIKEISHLRPVEFIKEFSEWTMRELDFTIEASNAERFCENFKNDERFHFPKVYWDFTTKRILTMEFVHGVELFDAAGIKKIGDDPRVLALNGLELGLRQLFIHGFFQADPHPGNFFALKNNVLCLYDFGMVGYLDRPMRDKLANVFLSFVDRDADVTIEKIIALSPEHPPAACEDFERKAAPLLGSWFYSKAEKKSLTKIFYELVTEGVKSGLFFPKNLIICSRAMLVMEATGLQLCPDFELYKEMSPLFEKVIKEKFDPRRLLKDVERGLVEYLGVLQQLPENTLKLIEKIEKGQIDVHIDKSEIVAIKDEMERVNNTRLLSIVVIALLVSSGVILRFEQQTFIFGVSVAKVELTLAVIIGLWLFFNMTGKNRRGE